MAYKQTKKLTDTEKRLLQLKTQLYGKEGDLRFKNQELRIKDEETITLKPQYNPDHSRQLDEQSFVKKDLIKIGTLASSALAIQLIISFLINQGVIKF